MIGSIRAFRMSCQACLLVLPFKPFAEKFVKLHEAVASIKITGHTFIVGELTALATGGGMQPNPWQELIKNPA